MNTHFVAGSHTIAPTVLEQYQLTDLCSFQVDMDGVVGPKRVLIAQNGISKTMRHPEDTTF